MYNGNSTLNETSTTDSPGQSKGNKGSRRAQNVVPVQIVQLKKCGKAEFSLHNLPVELVHLMGVVDEIKHESTHIVYKFRDYTGYINLIYWLQHIEDEGPTNVSIKVGDRVEVYGKVRERDDELMVMVIRMSHVKRLDDVITFHLECCFVDLMTKKNSVQQSTTLVDNPGKELSNTMFSIETSLNNLDLTEAQWKVFNIVHRNKTERGYALESLLSHFKKHEFDHVKNTIQSLIAEGHVFTTHDDNHFRSSYN